MMPFLSFCGFYLLTPEHLGITDGPAAGQCLGDRSPSPHIPTTSTPAFAAHSRPTWRGAQAHQQPSGLRKKRAKLCSPRAALDSSAPCPPRTHIPTDREEKQVCEHLQCTGHFTTMDACNPSKIAEDPEAHSKETSTQGHTARKWQGLNLNQVCLTPK